MILNLFVKKMFLLPSDLMGDPISHSFYKHQLVFTNTPDFDEDYFAIEEVIKPGIRKNGKKYCEVKFQGYLKKFSHVRIVKARQTNKRKILFINSC
jgi:hypothetical protein